MAGHETKINKIWGEKNDLWRRKKLVIKKKKNADLSDRR